MEFIEVTAFTKNVYNYLTDIVPGSGGVRKLRWGASGKGKSVGVRVIYYFKKQDDEIWLLTIYSKSEMENIPVHILRQIRKEIENG